MHTTTKRLLLAATFATAGLVPAVAGGQSEPPQQITPPTSAATPALDHRCPRGRSSVKAYRAYAGRVYRRHSVGRAAHRRLAYMRKCQRSTWAKREVDRYRVRFKRERVALLDPWLARWRALSAVDRAWAIGTAHCESGMDPTAVSPHGDHGAMQFKLATAAAAGFVPPDPKLHTLREQLVRAVWWMHRAGKGQWPVCGRR